MSGEISRRELIKLGAAATIASVAVRDGLAAPRAPAFFTPEQFALVEELSEMIVPTDDHSPGAKAAQVAAYIDARLAEAWEEKERMMWKDGLERVERLSNEMNGAGFLRSTPDQRVAVLTRMARNEARPTTPDEMFFAELKTRVVHAYYTSEIGLKQDIEYKGNTYQNEYAGIDVSETEK